MNGYAMFRADQSLRLANERLADFRLEAANDRLARRARPTVVGSIATRISSFVAALRVVDSVAPRTFPHIAEYPYRS